MSINDFSDLLTDRLLKHLINYQTKNKFLYHYTDLQALLSILKYNELWVTRSDYLKDFLEIKYTRELLVKHFRYGDS